VCVCVLSLFFVHVVMAAAVLYLSVTFLVIRLITLQ